MQCERSNDLESKKSFDHEILRTLETHQIAKLWNVEDEDCVSACLQVECNQDICGRALNQMMLNNHLIHVGASNTIHF